MKLEELEADAQRATFGEFGVALVADVFSPRLLQRQLAAALDGLRRGDVLAEFATDIGRVHVLDPVLVKDDGYERSFSVTVRARLKTKLGPRVLAMGVDASVEIDLVVRLRTFHPAIVDIDIDPVTSDDLRVKARARTDWLPVPLYDGGGVTRLARTAERALSIFSAALNRSIEASAPQRQLDVLDQLRRIQTRTTPGGAERAGTLDPEESLEWPIRLAHRERVQLQLWAEAGADPDAGCIAPAPSESEQPSAAMRLSVSDAGGRLVGEARLPVPRTAPDLDTLPVGTSVTAAEPGTYQVRLANHADRPVTYRVNETPGSVPGEQISFAEFGEVLIRQGLSPRNVSDALNAHLAPAQFEVQTPVPVRGSVAVQVTDIEPAPETSGERRFRMTLDVEVELLLRAGDRDMELTGTLRVPVMMCIVTLANPAALQLGFDPVAVRDVRLLRAHHKVRRWWMPIPATVLTRIVRRRVADELNSKLDKISGRLVAADLGAEIEVMAGRSRSNSCHVDLGKS
ncbi:MAG TPA: hypothetical protein VGM60_10420 [Pseudonocardia sp.]|uniref:hypothetical protein n=1 Tax=Pseudonocardia sp. TaxID=60912 RepID=UPI002F42C1B3